MSHPEHRHSMACQFGRLHACERTASRLSARLLRCHDKTLILPVHSCLKGELIVNENLNLVPFVRLDHGARGLAIDGEYRSAMSVPSKPSVCDSEVVGPLNLALHCRK